jgi:hypothetical protein
MFQLTVLMYASRSRGINHIAGMCGMQACSMQALMQLPFKHLYTQSSKQAALFLATICLQQFAAALQYTSIAYGTQPHTAQHIPHIS